MEPAFIPDNLTLQAALLKQRGDTTVIAIGIGNATDPKELSNIASDKGANNSQVYQVGDYDALQTLNSLVAYVACGGTCFFLFYVNFLIIKQHKHVCPVHPV